jgi:hypothetical protein
MHVPFREVPPVPVLATELTDEQVQQQQPAIRGQLIQRLERMYALVESELDRGELEAHQDPRFFELGLRIIDREAKLYRLLDAPKVQEAEPEEQESVSLRQRQQIEQQLRELESRLPS